MVCSDAEDKALQILSINKHFHHFLCFFAHTFPSHGQSHPPPTNSHARLLRRRRCRRPCQRHRHIHRLCSAPLALQHAPPPSLPRLPRAPCRRPRSAVDSRRLRSSGWYAAALHRAPLPHLPTRSRRQSADETPHVPE